MTVFYTYTFCKVMKKLNIETLELRRLRFDLLMYYKIIQGSVCIQCDDFLSFRLIRTLLCGWNHFKLVMPNVKNNNLSNMFALMRVGALAFGIIFHFLMKWSLQLAVTNRIQAFTE